MDKSEAYEWLWSGLTMSLGGLAAAAAAGPATDEKMSMLTKITRTQLERAVMIAKPPEDVATNASKAARRKLMDMSELVRERAQMQRLGFVDTVYLIDEELRFRREKKKREKDEYEINLVNQRIRALTMMHNRRKLAHEEKCANENDVAAGQVIGDIYRFAFSLARFTGGCVCGNLVTCCLSPPPTGLPRVAPQYENDLEELIERHEKEYEKLIEDIALRATGGVTLCDEETHKYLSKQNRIASFNTRRPRVEVMRLRENAQRLRDCGRMDEANEFAVRAARIDEQDENRFREKIIDVARLNRQQRQEQRRRTVRRRRGSTAAARAARRLGRMGGGGTSIPSCAVVA